MTLLISAIKAEKPINILALIGKYIRDPAIPDVWANANVTKLLTMENATKTSEGMPKTSFSRKTVKRP